MNVENLKSLLEETRYVDKSFTEIAQRILKCEIRLRELGREIASFKIEKKALKDSVPKTSFTLERLKKKYESASDERTKKKVYNEARELEAQLEETSLQLDIFEERINNADQEINEIENELDVLKKLVIIKKKESIIKSNALIHIQSGLILILSLTLTLLIRNNLNFIEKFMSTNLHAIILVGLYYIMIGARSYKEAQNSDLDFLNENGEVTHKIRYYIFKYKLGIKDMITFGYGLLLSLFPDTIFGLYRDTADLIWMIFINSIVGIAIVPNIFDMISSLILVFRKQVEQEEEREKLSTLFTLVALLISIVGLFR